MIGASKYPTTGVARTSAASPFRNMPSLNNNCRREMFCSVIAALLSKEWSLEKKESHFWQENQSLLPLAVGLPAMPQHPRSADPSSGVLEDCFASPEHRSPGVRQSRSFAIPG